MLAAMAHWTLAAAAADKAGLRSATSDLLPKESCGPKAAAAGWRYGASLRLASKPSGEKITVVPPTPCLDFNKAVPASGW